MASTYSTELRLELMANGENDTTWGTKTNTNLQLLESSISGLVSFTVTTADVTLTTSNGADDQSRHMILSITGALTASRSVIVPTQAKLYLVKNGGTGSGSGYTLTVKTSAGTGVIIPQGHSVWVYCDGTNVVAAGVNLDSVPLPKSYIKGLRTSNNGSDATNDLDIATGICRDATDTVNMSLASALTKQLDAAWAVGTNQGGLDTGSKANSTLYAVWLIKRSDTGVVDVLFSTSFTAPTMPSNYDYKRLIGAIRTTSGGVIEPFTQSGDEFYFHDWAIDFTDATITASTFETGAVGVPPRCIMHGVVTWSNDTAGGLTTARADVAMADASAPTFGFDVIRYESAADKVTTLNGLFDVLVNASSQIKYAASEASGTTTLYVYTRGFTMTTRSTP